MSKRETKPTKIDYISYILQYQYIIKGKYKLTELNFFNITRLELIAKQIKNRLILNKIKNKNNKKYKIKDLSEIHIKEKLRKEYNKNYNKKTKKEVLKNAKNI